MLPVDVWYLPSGQSVHEEANSCENFPAAQVSHWVAALLLPLKVYAGQPVHVASAVMSAEAVKNSPAGQVVVLAAHDVTVLSPALNSSASQAVHVASPLGEPAVKYVPAAHDAVRVWHGP